MQNVTAGRGLLLAVLGLLTIGYAAQVFRNTCFFPSGPDSTGYVSEAKLFGSGRLRVPVEPLRQLGAGESMIDVFVPLGFAPGPDRTMIPTYPPGLPLHMLAMATVVGWSLGPFLVSPLAGMATLVLLYAVARELGLGRGWSVVAPLLLAPTAVFLAFGMQPMSDVVATFWVLLTIGCALRSRRVESWAFLAGAALAIAVTVRPTNALAALAVVLALPARGRTWMRVALGGLVPGAALLWLNQTQYGSPFRFGFASVMDVLTWRPFGVCAGFHAWWTMRMLSPLLVALALFVFVLRKVPLRLRLMLAAWFAGFYAFYCFYAYCPAWGAVRFLLPAFPAVILAGLLVLQGATSHLAGKGHVRSAGVVAALTVAIILAVEMDLTSEFRVFRVDDYESVFPETVRWTDRHVPPNGLVVSGVFSGAFYEHGRWTARWDRLDPDRFRMLRAHADRAGLRLYAVTSDGEVSRAEFLSHVPGRWTPIARHRDVTLYRLDS